MILEINAKLEIGLSKSYPIEEYSSNKTRPGNLALFWLQIFHCTGLGRENGYDGADSWVRRVVAKLAWQESLHASRNRSINELLLVSKCNASDDTDDGILAPQSSGKRGGVAIVGFDDIDTRREGRRGFLSRENADIEWRVKKFS